MTNVELANVVEKLNKRIDDVEKAMGILSKTVREKNDIISSANKDLKELKNVVEALKKANNNIMEHIQSSVSTYR